MIKRIMALIPTAFAGNGSGKSSGASGRRGGTNSRTGAAGRRGGNGASGNTNTVVNVPNGR